MVGFGGWHCKMCWKWGKYDGDLCCGNCGHQHSDVNPCDGNGHDSDPCHKSCQQWIDPIPPCQRPDGDSVKELYRDLTAAADEASRPHPPEPKRP